MNGTAIPFLLFTKKKVEERRFNVFSANREPREVLGCPGNVISNSRTDQRINRLVAGLSA